MMAKQPGCNNNDDHDHDDAAKGTVEKSSPPPSTTNRHDQHNQSTNINNMKGSRHDSSSLPSFDEMLNREMQSLSVQERSDVYEDINAISRTIHETEEFIQSNLFLLGLSLNAISFKPAFDLACQQNMSFVWNRSFCLMFLRARSFDPQKAAECMVGHFELKLRLWGLSLLTRRITLNDMDSESRKTYVNGGAIQILPIRDVAGRVVFFSMEKDHRQHYPTDESIVRVFISRLIWYNIMSIIQDDVESQKNGVVYIAYSLGFEPKADILEREVWLGADEVTNVCPVRITSFLFCYDDRKLEPMINVLAAGLEKTARCRFKPIFGDDKECKQVMMTLGIPVERLPYDMDEEKGEAILNNNNFFNKWLKIRKRIEADPNHEYILKDKLLGFNDIVVEKGQCFQTHTGNRRFRDIVESAVDAYRKSKEEAQQASKTKKVSMSSFKVEFARGLVNSVLTQSSVPMRFVKKVDNGIWEEAPIDEAVTKAKNLLHRIDLATKSQRQQSSKGTTTDPDHTKGKITSIPVDEDGVAGQRLKVRR